MIVSAGLNTATIDLLVGGVVQTVYAFDGSASAFTLSKRDDDVTVNRDEQRGLNVAIDAWLRAVLDNCSGWGSSGVTAFTEEVEDDGGVRTYLLKFGTGPDKKKAIKAIWNRSGVTCLYEKRPALMLSLEAFRRFRAVLNRIDLEMMAA